MCRLIYCVVIFVVIFSSALSEKTDEETNKNITECLHSKTISSSRNQVNECYKEVVNSSLGFNSPGHSKNVTDLGNRLESLYKTYLTHCNVSLPVNVTNLMKLIEFSLSNNSFTEFYKDIDCVKKVELNISSCVKTLVGYIPISKNNKHSSWYKKINLHYDTKTCDVADMVKQCTMKVLSPCKEFTRRYIESLFELPKKNCRSQRSPELPPEKSSGLSVGAIIGICTGVLIIVIIVLFVVHIKLKK